MMATDLQPLLMEHGMSVAACGTVVFIATMTEGPLLLFSGRMMDRLRSRPALMACFAMLGAVLLCLGISPILPPVIAASLVRPLVGMVFNMLALKITILLAPGEQMSTAIGLTGAAKCVGVIAFQGMGGSLMDAMGIGALFVRRGVVIDNLIDGGGQEKRKRAGTENLPYILGLAKALEIAKQAAAEVAGTDFIGSEHFIYAFFV